MSSEDTISYWQKEVQRRLPHLSKPQAAVLGLWSYGMVVSQSCGISTIAALLAELLGKKRGSVRQRLREWYYEVGAKRGAQRRELEVESCFVPLLRWVMEHWRGSEQTLALAMDATTLGQRFTVLAISVVYRSCAIPVAWQVLPAKEKGAWNPHWERLLKTVSTGIGKDWSVVVMADRGLYGKWLFEQIVAQGWHPLLRVKAKLSMRLPGEKGWQPIGNRVASAGQHWCGRAEWGGVERKRRVKGTVVAVWEEGYEEPLLVVTDLPESRACAAWYGMRFWIEGGFKDQKRGGLQWHHTKMTDVERASRLWLAMAVATLWMVAVGGEHEAQEQAARPQESQAFDPNKRPRHRELSCFRRGQGVILASLLRGERPSLGSFVPEVWPQQVHRLPKPTSSWVKKKRQKEEKRYARERAKRKRAQQASSSS